MNLPLSLEHLTNDVNQRQQLSTLLKGSDWCSKLLQQKPDLLSQLLDKTNSAPNLYNECTYSRIKEFLAQNPGNADELKDFDRALRECRQYFMCYVIWRDLNRLASMEETCTCLSWFAELSIQLCLEFHYTLLKKKLGAPQNNAGEEQGLLVLGMGKLGAWELNLSSDIDLIFCYAESGATSQSENPLTNQEFFSRLGKNIIQSLDAITEDGFVFRVDMRLRPYGQSGALVSNFSALEDYYQTQGREWERYAMVKARIVASNAPKTHSVQLMQLLRSFTYRKYVDFSVIDALRKLKELINQEVKRRKLDDNIKLGPGGIREVEFIAQVFQLIRGGRDTQLQDNRLKIILPELENMGCLPDDMAKELWQAYVFLRNTEHAIQAWKDEQSQSLPRNENDKLRLAQVMGYATWDDYFLQLEAYRHLVHAEFQELIAPIDRKENGNAEDQAAWVSLWSGGMGKEAGLVLLEEENHENAERSFALIEELRLSNTVAKLHASSRERLDEFIPRLLSSVSQTATPTETLARIIKLVNAIVRRSAYLLLLVENPSALEQLVKLSVASPWIADQLALHPALLDELLDQSTLYHPPVKAELHDELQRHMLRIPEDDLEAQMDALRYFRSSHALRVAACEITGALPLMKVSDYLSWLAEVILQYVLQLCWREMTSKHGYPDANSQDPRFIIVGYGKLGGIELGHGSDLDLVFIYDADPLGQTSGDAEGKRQLDNSVFYTRLGQKIIHILNTNTVAGQLYEVDMRLRPSGNSGMLVSSITAFEKYQSESAWTWEHQALVRARVVAGSAQLTELFEKLRHAILCSSRDLHKLRVDVAEMREKMRAQLGSGKTEDPGSVFHLKQDAGGIVDIEFMVQYAVLAWASKAPELTRYTDNIRILECLAQSGLLGTQEVDELTEAYKAFRSIGHSLTLQQQTNLIDGKLLVHERQTVRSIWQSLLANA